MKMENPIELYYNWLIDKVAVTPALKQNYSKLLRALWDIDFTYTIPRDENREMDGLRMRITFENKTFIKLDLEDIDKRCSVLEMMVALACRCDDQLMWDDTIGSRASDWFFIMIDSMGLIGMKNSCFDYGYTIGIVNAMLLRYYKPDGRGGLFITNDPTYNMPDKEIWFQMSKFLTENDDSQIEQIINDLHVKELYFRGKEE